MPKNALIGGTDFLKIERRPPIQNVVESLSPFSVGVQHRFDFLLHAHVLIFLFIGKLKRLILV
jgi:hypothetical protein